MEAYFTGNDTQSNEEQLEMLLMTLEEVRHGICLFQSENQAKRVSLIQERFGKEKVIVHNIAGDDEEKGMVSSQDFKRWASESDAEAKKLIDKARSIYVSLYGSQNENVRRIDDYLKKRDTVSLSD